jgi:hypothetical protein
MVGKAMTFLGPNEILGKPKQIIPFVIDSIGFRMNMNY